MSMLNGNGVIHTEEAELKKTSQSLSTEKDKLATIRQNLYDKSNDALENWIGTAGVSFAKAAEMVDIEMKATHSKIYGIEVALKKVANNRQQIDDEASAGALGKSLVTNGGGTNGEYIPD